jgi:DNA-directed RNA polymerase specialized sigma24 family protein
VPRGPRRNLRPVPVEVAGLTYKEAAQSLGTRTGTIMSRLYRAREQVALRMEES